MKKPEEIKKGLEYCANSSFCDEECPYFEECNEGLESHATDALAYIQQLESQVPRWIPVEERLPEDGAFVAVYIDCDNNAFWIETAFRRNGAWRIVGEYIINRNITHWMPLPEAPKEAT